VASVRTLVIAEIREVGREQTWNPCVRVLEGHSFACLSVVFSPDGRRLVSGSEGLHCPVMERFHWRSSRGDDGSQQDCSFTRVLAKWDASSPQARTIRLSESGCNHWFTSRLYASYTGHSAPVLSITFSADSLRIVSGDDAGLVHVWLWILPTVL